ncbi:MAG: putative toxin-antitoxin system toxin component, PIN family [Candidatus Diapherotrites archaeon]|nr:putative toxin-antitoxin system toxin component, PIN family [Candidatus Diapherotrites archaeon]
MLLFTKHAKVRVVLDTNIVVSALIEKRGYPAEIFRKLISEEIECFTSQEILDEIEDVFKRTEIVSRTLQADRESILTNFKIYAQWISIKTKVKTVLEDSDDDKFIECALDAKADFIVSGDRHLLKLKEFKGIKIIKAKEFIDTISGCL